MSESPVDCVGGSTLVISRRVHMLAVSVRGLITCWSSVVVQWEQLCECVTHFELAVECSIELCLWVQASVLKGPPCCGRLRVIGILVR